MNYLSVCSGIEAATVAWHPLGWKPFAFAEIEKFPSAVLAHHYPHVPNLGDMTKFKDWPDATPDVLVGGTPCQSFSVAGLRKGMDDPRGNLALVYLGIADRYRPEWLLWENVPGVLSSNGGRDFGSILGGMAELGYGFAYRVLDAQYVRVDGFGRAVPQRRRRVFVVGNLGSWRRAAAVLFERESLSWDSPPSRETGQGIAAAVAPSLTASGRGVERTGDTREVSDTVTSKWAKGSGGPAGSETGNLVWWDGKQVSATLTKSSHAQMMPDKGNFQAIVAVHAIQVGALRTNPNSGPDGVGVQADIAYTLEARAEVQAVSVTGQISHALKAEGAAHQHRQGDTSFLVAQSAVRRLTPRECERLQGFPDDYTRIPWRGKPTSPDGPRYKALGNSMAVNVTRWIGMRIQHVSDLAAQEAIGDVT